MSSFVKLDPPPLMYLHPTPEKYDFDEFESTLSKVAFTNVEHFLRK